MSIFFAFEREKQKLLSPTMGVSPSKLKSALFYMVVQLSVSNEETYGVILKFAFTHLFYF